MGRDSIPKGQLIAVEGGQGRYVGAAARFLLRYSKVEAGISAWDASSIFYEMRCGNPGDSGLSPRVLVLLYAADLAFRLRWDIRPALEEGRCVIAAPYVETAIAFAGPPACRIAGWFSCSDSRSNLTPATASADGLNHRWTNPPPVIWSFAARR